MIETPQEYRHVLSRLRDRTNRDRLPSPHIATQLARGIVFLGCADLNELPRAKPLGSQQANNVLCSALEKVFRSIARLENCLERGPYFGVPVTAVHHFADTGYPKHLLSHHSIDDISNNGTPGSLLFSFRFVFSMEPACLSNEHEFF